MNAPDPQLSLFDPPHMPEDPDAVALVEYLDRAFTWRTRAQIMKDLGFDERRIRLARAAADDFITTCHLGFRHMRHCTPDDRAKCPEFFENQAKDMMHTASKKRRIVEIWNFFDQNRHQHPEPAHA